MLTKKLPAFIFAAVLSFCAQSSPAQNQPMSPVITISQQASWDSQDKDAQSLQNEKYEQAQNLQGGQSSRGQGQGSPSPQNQALKTQNDSPSYEQTAFSQTVAQGQFANKSAATGEAYAGPVNYAYNTPLNISQMNNVPNPDTPFFTSAIGNMGYGSSLVGGGCCGAGGPGGGNVESGAELTNEISTANAMETAHAMAQKASDAQTAIKGEKANANAQQGARASSAGEDAKELMHSGFESFMEHLINVANENAGAPCSSRQPTKTYSNVVWMVMQMYKHCYIPMAILFLLPGAIITNAKTLVAFGILGTKDDDTQNPFTGVLRAIIAVFLIPASQLAVSYVIDVGNALEDSASQYVSLPLIYLWCEEQIQTFDPSQQGDLTKNMPTVPMAPYRGKFAGMPVKGAILEQVSGLDLALMELVNECYHMLTVGMNVICGFQVVMICYLFVMGPLAAAFFAWPAVGRDLFRRAFGTWLDGVVVLSLWKFWWNVVLLCMTARLQSGLINPFDPFEVYYLIAFMSIMLVVPFNPFDFRPGEIVTHVLSKAEGVAAKVAQSGKGGGSGGGRGKAKV